MYAYFVCLWCHQNTISSIFIYRMIWYDLPYNMLRFTIRYDLPYNMLWYAPSYHMIYYDFPYDMLRFIVWYCSDEGLRQWIVPEPGNPRGVHRRAGLWDMPLHHRQLQWVSQQGRPRLTPSLCRLSRPPPMSPMSPPGVLAYLCPLFDSGMSPSMS